MRRTLTTFALPLSALALALNACGNANDTDDSAIGETTARTIEIEMRDNTYSPDTVSVDAGEEVRFVFTNAGKATHDAFIGDEAAQDDHEMEMNGDMGRDDHTTGEGDTLTVKPGDTGELVRTFESGDDEQLLIGCHEPGHYESGMRLSIVVS